MSCEADPARTRQMKAFDIEKVTNAFRIFSTNHKYIAQVSQAKSCQLLKTNICLPSFSRTREFLEISLLRI